jgi:hypothetical protein
METLSKHFRVLTKAAMGSHGFAQADILGQWDAIAGERLAGLCKPERIKWPRTNDQRGGTLTLQAQAGRALDVQYAIPALKERVNQFFGYEAISAIKVVQGHDLAPPAPKPAPSSTFSDDTISADLSSISDPELKAALARLGQSLKRSPQR